MRSSAQRKEDLNSLFCRDVLWSMIPYNLREGIWKLYLHYSYILATLSEMLQECHNLPFRIRMLWKRRHHLSIGHSLGPFFGKSDEHLVGCTRTLGCIQDTQGLLSNTRATWLEVELFLEGWQRGAEWEFSHPHVCTPGSCNRLLDPSVFPDWINYKAESKC